jgi:plastocyanin
MRRSVPVIVVAAAAVGAAGCGGSSNSSSGGYSKPTSSTTAATTGAASDRLSGSVGPGFDISMDKPAVAAGSYTLDVDDQASSHNFHLTGPGGVDIKTDISGTGKKTFTVTLQKGTYRFVCDAHPSSMHGTLTVN